MKMEQTECSEMLACKIQTPGNYPEESLQHSEHFESLKLRKLCRVTMHKGVKFTRTFRGIIFFDEVYSVLMKQIVSPVIDIQSMYLL
jgi:hypothetical protein